IGPTELLVIILIAIVVVGPRRVPEIMRGVAKFYQSLKSSVDNLKNNVKSSINIDDEDEMFYKRPIDKIINTDNKKKDGKEKKSAKRSNGS
ncbi:MAG: twin-arginine translocase TatA/TatE family subunit, partial [Deltaproteobacteria bacterium]|nr:twin-arginine translocase TatA/TatE family subunit [Deltaproteobacteria bacterium]